MGGKCQPVGVISSVPSPNFHCPLSPIQSPSLHFCFSPYLATSRLLVLSLLSREERVFCFSPACSVVCAGQQQLRSNSNCGVLGEPRRGSPGFFGPGCGLWQRAAEVARGGLEEGVLLFLAWDRVTAAVPHCLSPRGVEDNGTPPPTHPPPAYRISPLLQTERRAARGDIEWTPPPPLSRSPL